MKVHRQEEEVVFLQRGAGATCSMMAALPVVGISVFEGGRGSTPRRGGADDGPRAEELHVGDALRRARQCIARLGTTPDGGAVISLAALAVVR